MASAWVARSHRARRDGRQADRKSSRAFFVLPFALMKRSEHDLELRVRCSTARECRLLACCWAPSCWSARRHDAALSQCDAFAVVSVARVPFTWCCTRDAASLTIHVAFSGNSRCRSRAVTRSSTPSGYLFSSTSTSVVSSFALILVAGTWSSALFVLFRRAVALAVAAWRWACEHVVAGARDQHGASPVLPGLRARAGSGGDLETGFAAALILGSGVDGASERGSSSSDRARCGLAWRCTRCRRIGELRGTPCISSTRARRFVHRVRRVWLARGGGSRSRLQNGCHRQVAAG